MQKGILADKNGWVKGLVWFGIMLTLTIVVMVGWTVLPIDHQATKALKWFQFVQTIATFLIPPYIIAWLCSQKPKQWLQLDSKPAWWMVVSAIVIMVVALPGINLLADWNSRMSLPEWLKPLEELMRQQEDAAQSHHHIFELEHRRFHFHHNFASVGGNIGVCVVVAHEFDVQTFVFGIYRKSKIAGNIGDGAYVGVVHKYVGKGHGVVGFLVANNASHYVLLGNAIKAKHQKQCKQKHFATRNRHRFCQKPEYHLINYSVDKILFNVYTLNNCICTSKYYSR